MDKTPLLKHDEHLPTYTYVANHLHNHHVSLNDDIFKPLTELRGKKSEKKNGTWD